LVSWIFISTIGWVVFFFLFRTEGPLDPDAVADEIAAAEAESGAAVDDPADTALQGPVPPPCPDPDDDRP
ncbi:MAG: TIGR00374 family protein, partial [Mycolicibacterium aromaticivorans]|nr:TIGR00374 family protein [Mycolicibacterium aromaticivorans]